MKCLKTHFELFCREKHGIIFRTDWRAVRYRPALLFFISIISKGVFGAMKPNWRVGLVGGIFLLSILGCRGAEIICQARPTVDTPSAESGKLTIAWEPNKERNLSGYRIYYGPSPGRYKSCADIGNLTEAFPGVIQYTLGGLSKGKDIIYPSLLMTAITIRVNFQRKSAPWQNNSPGAGTGFSAVMESRYYSV